MEYRLLGCSTQKISRIGLGCMMMGWRCNAQEAKNIFSCAHDNGVNFLDTSVSYSRGKSHEIIRDGLPTSSRDKWVIATKVGGVSCDLNPTENSGLSKKNIEAQCDLSLSQLGIDYIDVLQFHMPCDCVSINEKLEAIKNLILKGKIRFFGVCNYNNRQILELKNHMSPELSRHFVSHQFLLNYIESDDAENLLPQCHDNGITSIIWGPLSSGLLTNNYALQSKLIRYSRIEQGREKDAKLRILNSVSFRQKITELNNVLATQGISIQKQAIRWLLDQERIDCILLGPSNLEQFNELVKQKRN